MNPFSVNYVDHQCLLQRVARTDIETIRLAVSGDGTTAGLLALVEQFKDEPNKA